MTDTNLEKSSAILPEQQIETILHKNQRLIHIHVILI